jgi:hypothetical protein
LSRAKTYRLVKFFASNGRRNGGTAARRHGGTAARRHGGTAARR